MYNTDFDSFRGLLDQCAHVFGKPKPSDEVIQTYWKALSDRSFTSVKECTERHLRYGKFFPKPTELRPKEALKEETPVGDAAFLEAMRNNARYWLSRLKEDGEAQCRKEGLGARAIEQLWDWDRRIQAGQARG